MDFSKPVEFIIISPNDGEDNQRLDRFLSLRLDWKSRQYWLGMLKEKKVFVNERIVKKSYKVLKGDQIKILLPDFYTQQFDYTKVPLEIIAEDADFVAVNKSGNMAVQPGGEYIQNNLLNRLRYYYRQENPEPKTDVSIVHRIDRETSGVIIFAKNQRAATGLATQFENRIAKKDYLAIVHGVLEKPQGEINAPLLATKDRHVIVSNLGKPSLTSYKLQKEIAIGSLVLCSPHTGRQHQIRVHMAHLGHCLIADEFYGGLKDRQNPNLMTRHALHAFQLNINHPISKKPLQITAPMPADMQALCDL